MVGKAKEGQTGTLVRWKADSTIFDTIEYDPEHIERRLRELAYLNKEVTLTFTNERDVPDVSNDVRKQAVETEKAIQSRAGR